jgi:ABC-2 type transport system ATP-binding protein
MIEVKALTKRYGERVAIDRLTFNAKKGEIVGFLGPNGAGKTTTMRILTGFMPATDGEGKVAGYDLMTQGLEVRKRVGYLPEAVPLYPEMTVMGYLDFMADLRRVPSRQDRVDEVMELVNIADRATSYCANLSKGLRQRVGLAQALLHKPDVLIMDEPMDGLDPQQQIEVKKLLRDIGKDHTVMLSTHILAHAQELADRVIIINKGRIVAEDAPDRLAGQIGGGARIALTVGGDGAGLVEGLAAVPGVAAVHAAEPGRFEIDAAPGADPRPQIAAAVVGAGHALLELRREAATLERIFIELTRSEQAELTGGAEAPETTEEGGAA